MGSRLRRGHELTHLLLIWCFWLRAMELPWAVHENVVTFDTKILEDILKDMYQVIHLWVNPANTGELVNRRRIYSVLLHRRKTRVIADIPTTYAAVERKLKARKRRDLQEYLVATADDLLDAENAARQRRGLPSLDMPSGDWEYLLTKKQVAYLTAYQADWNRSRGQKAELSPFCIFDLTQNPAKRRVQTSPQGVLPTMRGCGLWWSPMHRRWVLASEAAFVHGIPLEVARQHNLSWSDIGNAMHICSVGSVLAVVLSCTAKA